MIKSQLVKKLVNKNPHLIHKDVEAITSLVLEKITSTLENDGRVEIRGFGSLSVKSRLPRIARNPKTGETIEVGSKLLPYFRAGKDLNKLINS